MPRHKLTEKSVRRLRAPTKTGKPVLFWDDGPKAVRGFGVLCSGVTSSKSYVVQRDLPNGRTRRATVAGTNETTLDAARKRAAELLMGMRAGIDPKQKASCGTLRTTIEAHRAVHAHRLRPRSERNYNSSIVRYLDKWLDRPLASISRAMVEQRHQEIAADVKARHTKAAAESAKNYLAKADKVEAMGWTDAAKRYRKAAAKAAARKPATGHATSNGVMRALRMYWNFAKDRDPTLPDNPVRLRKQWFAVPRRERLVRDVDMPKFFAAVMALPNPVVRDFILLMLYTGLRRRECASLRWADVDLKAREIRLPGHATKSGRKLDLPMVGVVHDLLVARRAVGDSGGFVFPANSASGHVAEPKFAFEQIANACGVRVSPHDLRRTFITAAARANINPVAIKCLVNHAIGRDVTDGYKILNVDDLRVPAQRVADVLSKLCGIVEPAGKNVEKLKA